MREAWLDWSGVRARIRAHDSQAESALADLALDFADLLGMAGEREPDLSFELHSRRAPSVGRPGSTLFKTRAYRVSGLGRIRHCEYASGEACVASFTEAGRCFETYSPDPESLREITWSAILSAGGESLDLLGRHRLHAAGLSHDGGPSVAVTAAPGAGKSSLATAWVGDDRYPGRRIYSDESPLLEISSGGVLMKPCPLRIGLPEGVASALRPGQVSRVFRRKRQGTAKGLFAFPRERMAEPRPLDWVLFGAPGAGSGIREISRSRAARRLVGPVILGLGLAQMAEFMLRFDGTSNLPRIAASRARLAAAMLRSCRFGEFSLSSDPRLNADRLQEFLEAQ